MTPHSAPILVLEEKAPKSPPLSCDHSKTLTNLSHSNPPSPNSSRIPTAPPSPHSSSSPLSPSGSSSSSSSSIKNAVDILRQQARELNEAANRLRQTPTGFQEAVRLSSQVLDKGGSLILTGMGKSGLVARKTAATLQSMGMSALPLHPADAMHGDLGMVRAGDVVVAISYSGETQEILRLLPPLARRACPIIAMTGQPRSTLARASRALLDVSVTSEAHPTLPAPTTSTTLAMAMGDALSLALADARQVNDQEFALHHPGGSLGRRLALTVGECMYPASLIPLVPDHWTVTQLFALSSRRRTGVVGVTLSPSSTQGEEAWMASSTTQDPGKKAMYQAGVRGWMVDEDLEEVLASGRVHMTLDELLDARASSSHEGKEEPGLLVCRPDHRAHPLTLDPSIRLVLVLDGRDQWLGLWPYPSRMAEVPGM
ncbi:MAG: hypothetical protein DHS80DRAFT_17759 [Piptocephalis tieghemiana]|nr:MAG: hypothetical protein DHS80DRAFT_17759 [Piptocephalis tieghemiana]